MTKTKHFFLTLALLLSMVSFSQVGIGTKTPNASSILDLTSSNKGLLLPRVANTAAVTGTPANGLMVYDLSSNCVKVYQNGAWSDCLGSGSGSATVAANCNANGFVGSYVSGVALSGASFSVTLTNSSFTTSTITFAAGDVVLSGVAGLTVGTPTGSPVLSGGSATLTSGESVIVTYPITGTPSCGTLTATWTKLSLNCTKTTGVSLGTFVTIGSNIVRSGSNITGFDANWTAIAGATGYTLEYSTSDSGPWTAFPSNPYTGTTAAITGLSAVQYWYRVTVGGTCAGSSGIGFAGCGANVGATFKIFMCYNLGVTGTQDPLSYESGANNGTLYQWGRNTDGHEVRNSLTQAGPVGAPVADRFITNNSGAQDYNWLSSNNTTLWGDGTTVANPAKATNDPCPAGFKVPSQSQWGGLFRDGFTSGAPSTATRNTWTWTGKGYTVGNSLYLPAAGYRNVSDASLDYVGSNGYYWSSTVNGTNSYYLFFSSGNVDPGFSLSYRGIGFSVPCISE